METLTYKIYPHSLSEQGIHDYSIIELCYTRNGVEYKSATSLYSKYILDQSNSADIIADVVSTLKTQFLSNFDTSSIDDKVIDPNSILECIRKTNT